MRGSVRAYPALLDAPRIRWVSTGRCVSESSQTRTHTGQNRRIPLTAPSLCEPILTQRPSEPAYQPSDA